MFDAYVETCILKFKENVHMAIMLQVAMLAESKGIRMFLGEPEWDWKQKKHIAPWVCQAGGRVQSFNNNQDVLKFVRSYTGVCASTAAVVEDVSSHGLDSGLDAAASECEAGIEDGYVEDAAPDTERSPMLVQYDEVMNLDASIYPPVGVCESVEELEMLMAESERVA